MKSYTNDLSDIFGHAMDASVDGIIITDNRQPDNPIIYCNSSFQKITGYRADEIMGHNCRFLQRDDRDQPSREVVAKAVKDGKACQIEMRNYRKDGTFFWNRLSLSPVKNEKGEVTHFIGIQNDITSHKQVETTLQREREKLENRVKKRTKELEGSEIYLGGIVETIRESVLILDKNLRIVSVNKHFERLFKVHEDELEGEELATVLNGTWNIDKLMHLLKEVLPTQSPFEDFEIEHTFPFIGKRRLLLNASQITLEGRYQDWILLAIEDITERYRIEKQKEDFIGIASHEMKTPLTVIKGQLQLLQRLANKENSTLFGQRVDQALLSIDKLNKLIANLLDVSQLQSGKLQFKEKLLNIQDVIDNALQLVKDMESRHTISVSGDTSFTVKGDSTRLSQVLTNLLMNATKYSRDSDWVGLHVGRVGDFVKVAVVDKGIGIEKEHYERVFDRFFRVADDENVYQGAGIGLYICKQIIEAHQGTLWVESKMGVGSTFSFTLPLSDA